MPSPGSCAPWRSRFSWHDRGLYAPALMIGPPLPVSRSATYRTCPYEFSMGRLAESPAESHRCSTVKPN
jgi:hypothetical protein